MEAAAHDERDALALLAALAQPVAAVDRRGVIVEANAAFARLVGRRRVSLIGVAAGSLVHSADQLRFRRHLRDAAAAGEPIELGTCRLIRADGVVLHGVMHLSMVLTGGADGAQLLVQFTDTTKLRGAERSARRLDLQFHAVIDDAPVGVFLADADGRLVYVNNRWQLIHDRPEDSALGSLWTTVAHSSDAERLCQAWATAQGGHPFGIEFRLDTVEPRWVRLRGSVLYDEGERNGFSGFVEDVTALRISQQQLTDLALHDPLTGLANRVKFLSDIDAAVRRSAHGVAVLMIDLHEFEVINDTFGHSGGDRLLVHVANQLRRSCRPGDTVARLGGDEFGAVFSGVEDATMARRLAERLLRAIGTPLDLDDATVAAAGSIGVALAGGPPHHVSALYDRADRARCDAKHVGPNNIAVSALSPG